MFTATQARQLINSMKDMDFSQLVAMEEVALVSDRDFGMIVRLKAKGHNHQVTQATDMLRTMIGMQIVLRSYNED